MMLREWAVITLVAGFLISIAVVARFSEIREKNIAAEKPLESPLLEVTLSGAVEKPGIYFCKAGTALKEVVGRAKLTPLAHRDQIPFKKVIYTSQTIDIPQKPGTEKNSFEQK